MCLCSQMTSALKAFLLYIQFSIYSWRARSWKILPKEVFFSPKAFLKQGKRGLPRMCCTTVCFLSFVLETDLWGRSEWMFSLVYWLQTSPESLVACFQVILPRNKVKDKCSNDPSRMRREKKEEFLKIKQTKKKEGEMNICWIQPTMPFNWASPSGTLGKFRTWSTLRFWRCNKWRRKKIREVIL